jgi:para-nitrobenzyl esterase
LEIGHSWPATPFSPVIDGEVLLSDPRSAVTAGAAANMPLMVGYTRDKIHAFTAAERAEGRNTEDRAERTVSLFAPDGNVTAY